MASSHLYRMRLLLGLVRKGELEDLKLKDSRQEFYYNSDQILLNVPVNCGPFVVCAYICGGRFILCCSVWVFGVLVVSSTCCGRVILSV